MEGYQEETSVLGKLIARSTLPIPTGHRDCASGSAETEGRDGAGDMHQREDLGEVDREREESGMIGELRVKCLQDNAVFPVRGTAGAAGYNISAASGCVIPAHGKGSVDTGLAVSLPPGTYARIAPRSRLPTGTLLMWELVLSIRISGARLRLSYSITLWKTSQSKQVIGSSSSF